MKKRWSPSVINGQIWMTGQGEDKRSVAVRPLTFIEKIIYLGHIVRNHIRKHGFKESV